MTDSQVLRRPASMASYWANSPRTRYFLRRVLRLMVSVAVLVTVAFLMVRVIPGDPARLSLGQSASASQVAQRRSELGLDRPLLVQYVEFWKGLFAGDLGTSYANQMPVTDVIKQRLPYTAKLAAWALVATVAVAIPLGMLAGARTRPGRGRVATPVFSTVSGFFTVVPDFILGISLVALFGLKIGWFPVAGDSGAWSYVLPVTALSIGGIAVLARIVRVETITILESDYVRTARAKRAPASRIYLRHVLPNLATPALTYTGMLFGGLLGGTVFVEMIFAWPGLGSLVQTSITQKDYPMVQGIVVVYGVIILAVNLVVDLLIALIDPRSQIGEM